MISSTIDTLARRAASRRGSLLMLGGAALTAAVASPLHAAAKKGGKGTNAKKQCKKQRAQCVAAVTDYCGTLLDPPFCESVYLPCCDEFIGCNVEAGITCILTAD